MSFKYKATHLLSRLGLLCDGLCAGAAEDDEVEEGVGALGGGAIQYKNFSLKIGLRLHFYSDTCLNYQF